MIAFWYPLCMELRVERTFFTDQFIGMRTKIVALCLC